MIKGTMIAIVMLAISAFAVGGLRAHAQTATTTITPSPTRIIPSGAPATGRAE